MANLHDMSIAVFIRALEQQHAYLHRAERWADEHKVDVKELLEKKLASDMKPLSFQLHTCCKIPNDVLARLNGQEEPTPFENDADSFARLFARLESVVQTLKAADETNFVGSDATFSMKMGRNLEVSFSIEKYLTNYAIPNFFFHHVTAYDILRNAGVPLGKKDYLFGHGSPNE